MTNFPSACPAIATAIFACGVLSPLAAGEPPAAKIEVVFDDLRETREVTIEPAPGESEPTADLVGKPVKLAGQLHDTGTLNFFTVHYYDGYRIATRRYPVDGRPLKRPTKTNWTRIDATVSKIKGRHSLEVQTIDHLTVEEIDGIARATADARRWVRDHREEIDLNKFKESVRFRNLDRVLGRGKLAALDLNKLPVREADWTVRVDLTRGVAEIIGTRYLVQERPQQTETWLDLIVVYDLKAKVPIRIIVDENGYFLE